MPGRIYSDIVEDFVRQLSSTSNLTFLTRGAKSRSLLEAVAAELVAQSRLLEKDIRESRYSQATDQKLDLLGDVLNVVRIRRRAAESLIGDLNVKFYVEPSVGSFGNLDSLPVINTGDRITTRSGGIVYEITDTLGTLSPSANVYYVGVKAIQSGAKFNLGKGSLNQHSYSDTSLKVTNEFPIINGRDDESNEEYRFRLFNAIRRLETANDRAVFLAARITPGVGDVKIIPRLFGIGSSAVVVRPTIGTDTPLSMINAVRSSVNLVKPNSSNIVVTPPDVIGFEFNIRVNYNRALSTTDKSRIEGNILNRLNRFFNNLDIGQSVSFNDIATLVVSSSGDIKSLGDGTNDFGRAWVYEADSFINNVVRRRREVLIQKNQLPVYSIPGHGLASLESSISFPIKITHGTER